MLFSRRAIVVILFAALIIPSVVRSYPSPFLPLVAKSLTYSELDSNPALYVNRPIWVPGYTNGPQSVMNVTSWTNLTQSLTLPKLDFWRAGIQTLFEEYSYFIFLNIATGFPAFGLVHGDIGQGTVIRLEVGITSPRFIPIVLQYAPVVVPLHAQVLAYVRVISADSLPFYYLEYLSWQPLLYNITQSGSSA